MPPQLKKVSLGFWGFGVKVSKSIELPQKRYIPSGQLIKPSQKKVRTYFRSNFGLKIQYFLPN